MAVGFIQLKFIEPDTLLNAGIFSVNKKITALSPWKLDFIRADWREANLQVVGRILGSNFLF